MDSDYVFADSKKINILPLMTQVGVDRIDNLYKKRFGMRQYLSPYTNDLTEVKYEEKLKKYLMSIFIDDNIVERIRKEFDAYIFLSYRKKDRQHANELMGLIHKNLMYRDVAIWYDEFLTPGENFNINIQNALDKSELFTLLVTPNLVNEQNYVQSIEYPKACDTGKKILPAEMVKTNRKELERMYRDIPPCINAHAEEKLSVGILDALKGISLKSNNDDPEHNYLIGLAYRDGIDVEVNKEYAAEMLTIAAEGGIPEAMIALYDLYSDDSELTNNPKALYWAQRIYDEIENDFCGMPELEAQERFIKMVAESEEDLHTYLERLKESWRIPLRAMNNLVVSLERIGNKEKAYELSQKLYKLCKEHLGECDLDTLTALQNMGFAYRNMGHEATAESLYQEAYTLSVQDIERNHDETCAIIEALTEMYVDHNQLDKAIELSKKTVDIQCDFYGRNSEEVYEALKKLTKLYIQVGEHMKAFDLSTQMYEIYNKVFGVLSVNRDMIEMLNFVGNIKKIALKSEKKKYIRHCASLPRLSYKIEECIQALKNMVTIYEYWEDEENVTKCKKKILKLQKELFHKHGITM